jgi:hypothetical protein
VAAGTWKLWGTDEPEIVFRPVTVKLTEPDQGEPSRVALTIIVPTLGAGAAVGIAQLNAIATRIIRERITGTIRDFLTTVYPPPVKVVISCQLYNCNRKPNACLLSKGEVQELKSDMAGGSLADVVQNAVDVTGMTDVPVEDRTVLLSDNGAGICGNIRRRLWQ